MPASVKIENAHGNRQVIPETAECVSQNKGGSSIVTRGDSGPGPTRWQLVGGISAELGGFRAAALAGRSRGGAGSPARRGTESSLQHRPGPETGEQLDLRRRSAITIRLLSYTQRRKQRLHICSLQDKSHFCSPHSAVNTHRCVVVSGAVKMVFSQDIALRLFSPSFFSLRIN